MGRLTTHVLDTAQGCPGRDIELRLFDLRQERNLLLTTRTNADGRTDKPLLEGERFQLGGYELEFDVGSYFREAGLVLAEPPFLDVVVIRFQLAEDDHYHVPLLVSPWSYSSYRGS